MSKELMTIIDRIARRGWCPATAGNFSLRLAGEPLRMLMSPSGVDKGLLTAEDLIEVSSRAEVLRGTGKASAEYLLHAVVYQERRANCVLHVHTVWNTLLSQWNLERGAVTLAGCEGYRRIALELLR